jgi:hypothetical protein
LWQFHFCGPFCRTSGGCYQQVCSHLVLILLDHVTRRCRSATKQISNFMTLQHMEPVKNMFGVQGSGPAAEFNHRAHFNTKLC